MTGLVRSVPNVNVYNELFLWLQRRVYPLHRNVMQAASASPLLQPYETITVRSLKLYVALTRNSMHTHLFTCASEIPLIICINTALILEYNFC